MTNLTAPKNQKEIYDFLKEYYDHDRVNHYEFIALGVTNSGKSTIAQESTQLNGFFNIHQQRETRFLWNIKVTNS